MADANKAGRANSIGVSGRALERLLEDLNAGGDGMGSAREFVRWGLAVQTVHMKFRQPGGADSIVRVASRNLSRGGMAVLHNAYLHPGSPCAVVLTHLRDGPTLIEGYVVRCQHRRGMVHEVGIKFNRPISVRDYVPLDSFSNCFSLERVDPQDLEGCVVHVEDSELDARLMKHFLRDTRLRIRQASTVEEGLALASEGCDLILTDLHLGEEDGAALVEAIRGRGEGTPVIMITCDTSPATREKIESIRANAFLAKPMTQELLLRALGEFLIANTASPHLRCSLPMGDPALSLVPRFVEDVRAQAKKLEQAAEREDCERCRAVCLQIYGSAPSLGFAELGRLAKGAADSLARSMSVPESIGEIRTLIASCQRVRMAESA
ncbi:MAG: response regulator [Phycisphaeraceae bacterium]|nr:response regulator [Phycisphaeraceae bacterium]